MVLNGMVCDPWIWIRTSLEIGEALGNLLTGTEFPVAHKATMARSAVQGKSRRGGA